MKFSQVHMLRIHLRKDDLMTHGNTLLDHFATKNSGITSEIAKFIIFSYMEDVV